MTGENRRQPLVNQQKHRPSGFKTRVCQYLINMVTFDMLYVNLRSNLSSVALAPKYTKVRDPKKKLKEVLVLKQIEIGSQIQR